MTDSTLPATSRRDDVTGQRFGRLVALEWAGKGRRGETLWLCQCDCGETKAIALRRLRQGTTASCGCLRHELLLQRITKHGESTKYVRSTEWNSWSAMIIRCTNPDTSYYADYGGRGITVCDRWMGDDGFKNFLEDMGRKPGKDYSLDRFPDNNGNYSPSNCRWATRIEQTNNTRSNVRIECNGAVHTVAEWSRLTGLSHSCIYTRWRNGWTAEQALTTPADTRNRVMPRVVKK